jgi:hypothetical protein
VKQTEVTPTEVIHVVAEVTPELQKLADEAKAANELLSKELDASRAALASEQEARKDAELKLSELAKELEGVRAAKTVAEERMNKMLTRGFSSGTPASPVSTASYKMPSLYEIARGLKA